MQPSSLSRNEKLSLPEAARALGYLNPGTIYRWVHAGLLPKRGSRRKLYVTRGDLRKFMRAVADAPPVAFRQERAKSLLNSGRL